MEFPPQTLPTTAAKLAIIRINQQKWLSTKTDKCFYVEKTRETLSPNFC